MSRALFCELGAWLIGPCCNNGRRTLRDFASHDVALSATARSTGGKARIIVSSRPFPPSQRLAFFGKAQHYPGCDACRSIHQQAVPMRSRERAGRKRSTVRPAGAMNACFISASPPSAVARPLDYSLATIELSFKSRVSRALVRCGDERRSPGREAIGRSHLD